jgi:hypothetical protein
LPHLEELFSTAYYPSGIYQYLYKTFGRKSATRIMHKQLARPHAGLLLCSEPLSETAAFPDQHSSFSRITALLRAKCVASEIAHRPSHSVETLSLCDDDSDAASDAASDTGEEIRTGTPSKPAARTAELADAAVQLRRLTHRLSHTSNHRAAVLSSVPARPATLPAPPMSLDARLRETRLGHAGASAMIRRQQAAKLQSDF